MEVTFELDPREVEAISGFVRGVYSDQLPFATATAINRTALAIQRKQRDHMRGAFEIRNEMFLRHGVRLKPFAKKRDGLDGMHATIAISSPGGGGRADMWTQHEDGGTKRPRGKSLAIPGEVKRTARGAVRKSNRPRRLIDRLQMKPVGRSRVFARKGTGVWVGKRGTFMIRRSGGTGGIFQRTGPGRGDYRTLYTFSPTAELRPKLGFMDGAVAVYRAEYAKQFEAAFDRAIRTAR